MIDVENPSHRAKIFRAGLCQPGRTKGPNSRACRPARIDTIRLWKG